MSFPVFLDTCTLFGQALCDTLLNIAEQGTFTPYWSARVLEAVERSVVESVHATPAAIQRRTSLMNRAFPGAKISGFDDLIDVMTNDPGDRHVLAACITSPANTLVTFNVKDFPEHSLAPYGIEVITPDEFLLNQLDLHPDEVRQGISDMLRRNKKPPQDIATLAAYLDACGTPRFSRALREIS